MSYTLLTPGQRYQIHALFIIGYNQTVIPQVIVSQNPLSGRSSSESVVGEAIKPGKIISFTVVI